MGEAKPGSPEGAPLLELERRFTATVLGEPAPMRSSMRGSLYSEKCLGYAHALGLEPGVSLALTKAAARSGIPMDVALLTLVVSAIAVADVVDVVEFTMYVPMRDGPAESTMVGLFADWRDLDVSVDFEFATVLGTALQLSHSIQHRRWVVFNALRKAERTVVNILPIDQETGSNFHNDGDHLWNSGDQLGDEKETRDGVKWIHQPLSITIAQQEDNLWWVMAAAGIQQRPPRWMRRFVSAFREALFAFIFVPSAKVHMLLHHAETKEGASCNGASPA